eukprot:TRINITY_DN6977_c0_g1_i1.p1 TRINITY_DN6977_c0_g1~~TRINITY_DN6977_c0_g1_i1.p1  ORF type:complete len:252 (-),score=48.31 TRINITY_DN6977_c0_g1_i1:209-964(-)
MPELTQAQVQSKEVLSWTGVHLFYADVSLCSRKVLLVLALKNVSFTPHVIDLSTGMNRTPEYLGINPRGLVPCLVHDGRVFIESNDICVYLAETFSSGVSLVPEDDTAKKTLTKLLDMEDNLHMSVRQLTFRYVIPHFAVVQMGKDTLEKMEIEDKTVQDVACGGQGRAEQRRFYTALVANGGIADSQVLHAVGCFREALGSLDRQGLSEWGEEFGLGEVSLWVLLDRLLLVGCSIECMPSFLCTLSRRPR